jgi:lactate racemase
MLIQKIASDNFLSDDDIRAVVADSCASLAVDEKRVLFIIPDSTRSMPLPLLFRSLHDNLGERVSKMDYLIALGTHPPMPEDAINAMLGVTEEERKTSFADVDVFNHAWQDPEALTTIGTLTEDDIEELSGGLLRESVDVTINKRILDYDLICIVGPVFPHEVVGFSGGHKYFFPGIAGEAILDVFHWIGALITNFKINGTKNTQVRAVIDKAASLVKVDTMCFCLTVVRKDTKAIFFGTPQEAWSAAADLSAQTHIVFKDKPFKTVLALAPPMYDEIWVAGKCMYKLEPVVADGGELIIYGSHIHEVSVTHDKLIKKVGYHVRDYFTKQKERFKDIPGTIKAHSTHVRGGGTYEGGVETPRVDVTLATSIPKDVCDSINLGYRDINTINVADYENREDDGILVVHNAGEILYRVKEQS